MPEAMPLPVIAFAVLELTALALPLAAAAVAFRVGRKHRAGAEDPAGDPHIATIEAATLGLLALLVAFTLSMAQDRFEIQRHLIADEANAIETAHLRTALIEEPAGTDARRLLRSYAEARMEFSDALDRSTIERAEQRAHALQADLWGIAGSEARARPTPTVALFVSSINDIIDVDQKRLTALETHLPNTILVLLFVVGMVACASVAYAAAWSGGRGILSLVVLPLVVGASLVVVVDLDKPRAGIIRVSDQPIERVQRSLQEMPPRFDRSP
jgi:hypothetical protein